MRTARVAGIILGPLEMSTSGGNVVPG